MKALAYVRVSRVGGQTFGLVTSVHGGRDEDGRPGSYDGVTSRRARRANPFSEPKGRSRDDILESA